MSEIVAALSFNGRHRDGVIRPIADRLIALYGKQAIFFDESYRWRLAKANGIDELIAYYRSAKLIVVFLCPEYGQHDDDQHFTRREWSDAVYPRIHRDKNDGVHLFRINLSTSGIDDLKLPGLTSASAFPAAVEDLGVDVVVEDIVRRLEHLGVPRPSAPAPSTEVERGAVIEAYRRATLATHGRVSMIGVHVAEFEFGMDDVYVPLRLLEQAPDWVIGGERRPFGAPGDNLGIEDVFWRSAPRGGRTRAPRSDVPTVMGDAGSGKTTALKKLLHHVFTRAADETGLPADIVPRFVRAADLKAILAAASHDAPVRRGRDWIRGPLGELVRRGLTADEQTALVADGRPLLLLLDGLDELADPGLRLRALDHLDVAMQSDEHLWAVVSCRHSARGYEIDFPARFKRFAVQPMTDDQRNQLAIRWFTAANRQLRRAGPEALAQTQTQELNRAMGPVYKLDPHLRSLVSTPLFATLQCVLHLWGIKELTDSAHFLRTALALLLERRHKLRQETKPQDASARALTQVLEDVSYRIQSEQRQDGLTRREWTAWLKKAVRAEIPNRNEAEWRDWLALHDPNARGLDRAMLGWLHTDADVLTELAHDQLIFSHRGLQEMLAAAFLVRCGAPGLETLARCADGQTWRAPFTYAARILGPERFSELSEQLVRHRNDWPALEELLQETLGVLRTVDPTPFAPLIENGSDEARQVVVNLFQHRNDEPVHRLRKAAARALRQVRDPAVQDSLRAFAGPFAGAARPNVRIERTTGMRFLAVPGGVFMMGADDIGDDEKPVHPVRLSPFWLAETAVTNQQYRPYVEATGKAPEYWNNPKFNQDRQPVVGVSWFDSEAYCRWLSERIDGLEAVLPSEAQWERAARGDDGRRYPWGDKEPNETLAWYNQDISSAAKPVGQYPAGRGPYGHLDLAGNVWEWCRDIWSEEAYRQPPHSASDAIDPVNRQGDDKQRPLRGGGFLVDPDGLRAARRVGVPAVGRLGFFGFRVCLSPPSTGGSGGEAP